MEIHTKRAKDARIPHEVVEKLFILSQQYLQGTLTRVQLARAKNDLKNEYRLSVEELVRADALAAAHRQKIKSEQGVSKRE